MSMQAFSNVSCSGCKAGRHAVYAPVFTADANAITTRRALKKTLAPRKLILREGEIPSHVYTLYSGWACAYEMLPNGRRQVLSFFIPGDLIALYAMEDEPLPYAVRSLTAVELCGFERTDFFSFLQSHPILHDNLCKLALAQFRDANDMLVDVGRRSASARVARFVLGLEARLRTRDLAADDGFALPLRQAVIADALGLTTVYLNRTLAALRQAGVLDIGGEQVTIRDRERLEIIAEGELFG